MNLDGRALTLARVRAGVSQAEIAKRLFHTQPHISYWEQGIRPPNWEELDQVLPELREIREKGCAAYCPKSALCKKDGKCLMAHSSKLFQKLHTEESTGLDRDVVAVVRCKNCVYGANYSYKDHYLCNRKMVGLMKATDFCSYGERRDSNV